jgi:hypothetical protein
LVKKTRLLAFFRVVGEQRGVSLVGHRRRAEDRPARALAPQRRQYRQCPCRQWMIAGFAGSAAAPRAASSASWTVLKDL